MTNWNPTKNPEFAVCSAAEFLKDEFVPQEVRDSYQQFIDNVDVATVPENDRGYKDFDWEGVDEKAKKRYTVTWNERFKFGAMRGPLPKWWKPKEAEVKEPEEGQARLDVTGQPAPNIDLSETNRLLAKNNELMEILVSILGGPKAVEAMQST